MSTFKNEVKNKVRNIISLYCKRKNTIGLSLVDAASDKNQETFKLKRLGGGTQREL